MGKSGMFVGLDVHQDSIDVALADGGGGEVRHYGRVGGDIEALARVVKKLISNGCELHFVYEAGPSGYGIYRYLNSLNLDCVVVAPSKIPRRSGDRVKTDRRDAEMLARLHRAGELSAVYVPGIDDEAMRDLTRGREDAVYGQTRAKQRLKSFLLRNGIRYAGRARWSAAHRRWLSETVFLHTAQQITFEEYLRTIDEAVARVDRLTDQIDRLVCEWRMAPVVEAFQALRGVSLLVAATVAAEIGDVTRFENPRLLAAYLGLVPSEHSSGASTRRGGITKTGNGHARRVLIEASWAYHCPAKVSRHLRLRQENLSKAVCDIAWKAQLRLCTRYRRLIARGKSKQTVVTAIARELSCFLWAIAREVEPKKIAIDAASRSFKRPRRQSWGKLALVPIGAPNGDRSTASRKKSLQEPV